MLSGTKRNRPRPLRRIRHRAFYPLPFGLDRMAGAGQPARLCARPRPLFLVCPPADGPLCARRLGGLPPAGLAPPRPENRLQGSALSRPVRLGLGLRGLRPSVALLGAGGAVPPRLHGLCPSGLLLSAGQPFRPVHAPHPGSALRLPEGRRGKRLFQSSAWFAAMFLAGLLPPMLFFLGSLLPKKRLTTAKNVIE